VVERPRALALTGPTTVGKTDLSLELARRLHAEIVSMDSRQVYRGMDVGTDKVRTDARAGIPHFGLDLVEPDETYSAGRFARDVRRWIDEIEGRAHVPLLVGGTGFFLRAVLEPIFREPPLDEERRARLRRILDRMPGSELVRWVERLDPARAALAARGGPQRLSRTLEVALLTGHPLSWWHETAPADGPAVPCLVVVLELPRDELDRRIDARVGRMVESGLLDEVRGLLAHGYGADAPGMTGTGYREIAAYLDGGMSLDDALEEMRRQTRRYARRQLTWFRNQMPADTLRLDARLPLEEKADRVVEAWRRRRGEGGA
jgi:tRNA dimethylallyltransferase